VDVGWSKLADLNIHEGKLLGCSYNQSCVGVWVVDISVCISGFPFYQSIFPDSFCLSLILFSVASKRSLH